MSIKVSYIRITPESPLLLGDRSGFGNFQETADFIPGSAVRGAVGGQLLSLCTQPQFLHDHASCPDRDHCPFWQMFGQDEPLFGNVYPGKFGSVWPLPLTARSCKRYFGFSKGKDDSEHHGIYDVLFTDLAYGLISDPLFPERKLIQPGLGNDWCRPEARSPHAYIKTGNCPVCQNTMQYRTTYYAWKDHPQPADKLSVSRATHVGINRARSVAEDEILFTQETILPDSGGSAFFGQVAVHQDKQEALLEALRGTHFVGRGRSRGYGEVQISMENLPKYPSLESRLTDFQLTASAALKPYHELDARVTVQLPGQLFSLTLRSPALLSERGRPYRTPSVKMLGLPDDVKLLRAWARMEQSGGWDGAARLPRRTRQAVQAGSVFLYYAPNSVSREELIEQLAELENVGIGDDRERGYGVVTVCAHFHADRAII